MTKSRGVNKPRVVWTEEQVATLRARYPGEKTEVIAKDLGIELRPVYAKAKQLGLAKSEEYLASPSACRLRRGDRIGAAYQFMPGHVPANKGIRRPGYAAGRMGETQFKKGTPPMNTMPIGSHRLDGYGVLQRKISNDSGSPSKRWRSVHELLWVEAHGPIPPKHMVIFKQGMKTNVLEEITIARLECVSFAENMKRNTRHNLPPELNEIIALKAVLTRQINKRTKQNHE